MYIRDIIHRSSRSLLSAKTRTILTAFAIAVGAFALTITLAASNGAQHYADMVVKNNFDPSELIITKDDTIFSNIDSSQPQVYQPSFGNVTSDTGASKQIRMLTETDISRLALVPGISSVRPITTLSLQYITRDGQKKYEGTAQQYSPYNSPDRLAGSIPTQLADHTIILPEGFVSALGFATPAQAIGKPIRLAVRKQIDQSAIITALTGGAPGSATATLDASSNATEEKFTVVAVTKKPTMLIRPGTSLYLNMNAHDLGRLNDYVTQGSANYHKYITAYATVSQGTDASKLSAAEVRLKKLGYSVQSVIDTEKTITQVISVLQGIVTVFGLIAVIASVFGIVNTMYISVLQRTREIGLMKAMGMHKSDINKLFLFEAGLIGLLGGVLGSLTALTLGTLLNPSISKKLSLTGSNLLEFDAAQIGIMILILVLIAVIAGLFPARKASRLDPIDALRTE